jgi:cell division protein FtsL
MFSQKNKQGWRNPWLFGLLAVVLAGILINAKFLVNVSNHPVRVLDEHYDVKKHNQYDAEWVKQQAERSTLGWKAKIHSPQQLVNDSQAVESARKFILLENPVQLNLDLNDPQGEPLQGVQITLKFQWPSNPAEDFVGEMKEVSPGRYETNVKFPRPGNWDMLIEATHEGRNFAMEQKLFAAFAK